MSICVETKKLSVFYGDFQALKSVSLALDANRVTALIGPSGCGKSTFLKALNRMNDLVDGYRPEGTILLAGEDIYGPGIDPITLRGRVGMVFQKPNPFPMSVYDNIAYGPRIHGAKRKTELDEIVERTLRDSAL